MKKIYVYLDDERQIDVVRLYKCGYDHIWVVRNYEEACITWRSIATTIEFPCVFLDLDHDLGEGKTGYDFAKYVAENPLPNPNVLCVNIHSMNPVGAKNIENVFTHDICVPVTRQRSVCYEF